MSSQMCAATFEDIPRLSPRMAQFARLSSLKVQLVRRSKLILRQTSWLSEDIRKAGAAREQERQLSLQSPGVPRGQVIM